MNNNNVHELTLQVKIRRVPCHDIMKQGARLFFCIQYSLRGNLALLILMKIHILIWNKSGGKLQ